MTVSDYRGDVRSVIAEDGRVEERNDYYPYGMAFYSPVASVQPWKHSGKEHESRLGIHWLDFGARRLDFAKGQWTTMDPLCEKTPWQSPYAYCGADPVNKIDPDGRYIISKEQAEKYPRLNLYLQKGIQGILDNPKIMDALRYAGRFSDNQIKEMVTYGKGPIINVTNTDGSYGYFTPKSNSKTLNIDEETVKKLEDAKGFDADIYLFLVAVTILHESSHYGDDLAGNPEGPDREDGNEFEKRAYGKVIDESNIRDYLINFYRKSQINKYDNSHLSE